MTEPEREVEVKLIGMDADAFEQELLARGAVFDVEEHQTNIHLDSSAHPLPPSAHMRIRLIEVEGKIVAREWTYKKRLATEDCRVNEEYTVHIEDEEALRLLLLQLGYDEQIPMHKIRRRYLFEDYRIEFDQWDKTSFPFPYIEVEAPSPARLHAFYAAFSIPKEKVSTLSIAELKEAWHRGTLTLLLDDNEDLKASGKTNR